MAGRAGVRTMPPGLKRRYEIALRSVPKGLFCFAISNVNYLCGYETSIVEAFLGDGTASTKRKDEHGR